MTPLILGSRQCGILRSVCPRHDPLFTASALRHLAAGIRGPYTDRELSLIKNKARRAMHTPESLMRWVGIPPLR